jgi:hypothetical protein
MMQLIEIQNTTDAKRFVTGPVKLLQDDPNYIQPLETDIEKVFDPAQNKAFRHGECIRWILVDNNNHFLGRIAAFINRKYKNKGDDGIAGGIGFFDCVNDQNAADLLFDVARNWLLQKECFCMDGPINFGERDKWWGLVISGHQPPLYNMNFNPPYYQTLFENYGFKPFFYQLCFGIDPAKKFNPKIYERHRALSEQGGYQLKHMELSKLDKYAADFAEVYNAAWAKHGGLKEMKVEQAIIMFKTMKPVIDPRIVWFVYHFDKPVAIFINLPDLNQWFKKLRGKFNLISKLKFLYYKYTVANTKMVGLVFGISPEYQGLGIDSFIIVEAGKEVNKMSYTQYEMQWIGDFNPKMVNIAKNFGDTFETRKLATFRYLFDQSQSFKRHPMID